MVSKFDCLNNFKQWLNYRTKCFKTLYSKKIYGHCGNSVSILLAPYNCDLNLKPLQIFKIILKPVSYFVALISKSPLKIQINLKRQQTLKNPLKKKNSKEREFN